MALLAGETYVSIAKASELSFVLSICFFYHSSKEETGFPQCAGGKEEGRRMEALSTEGCVCLQVDTGDAGAIVCTISTPPICQ